MDNEAGEHVTLTITVVRPHWECDVEVDGKLYQRVYVPYPSPIVGEQYEAVMTQSRGPYRLIDGN